jgi:hypothetical protein
MPVVFCNADSAWLVTFKHFSKIIIFRDFNRCRFLHFFWCKQIFSLLTPTWFLTWVYFDAGDIWKICQI